jgi:hypothetical protein
MTVKTFAKITTINKIKFFLPNMKFDIDGIFQQDAAEKDDRFWQNCPRFSRMPRKAISGSSV